MRWVLRILPSELTFEFARSSGSGGQHINRTNTAAILRWNLFKTISFNEEQKIYLINKLESRLTRSGDILIRSEEFRDQDRNKKRCLEKLDQMLERAIHIPKKRKPTKPSKAAKEKRLKSKKAHSKIKKLRSKKDW